MVGGIVDTAPPAAYVEELTVSAASIWVKFPCLRLRSQEIFRQVGLCLGRMEMMNVLRVLGDLLPSNSRNHPRRGPFIGTISQQFLVS